MNKVDEWMNAQSTYLKNVLHSINNENSTLLVNLCDIASMQPSVFIYCLFCLTLFFVVFLQDTSASSPPLDILNLNETYKAYPQTHATTEEELTPRVRLVVGGVLHGGHVLQHDLTVWHWRSHVTHHFVTWVPHTANR